MTKDERYRETMKHICHALERRYPMPFQKRHERARTALARALRTAPEHPPESLEFLEYRETALRQYDRAIAAADRSAGR